MDIAYTREFLVEAYGSRYKHLMSEDEYAGFITELGYLFYDELISTLGETEGKKKFREYCSLDADNIKLYKEKLKNE